MSPDSPNNSQMPREQYATDESDSTDIYGQLVSEFVGEVRSQFATLTGEIALRNTIIQQNDAYIYGDLLQQSINIPIGHDITPVNWLRRVVEIHAAQLVSDGLHLGSTYTEIDVSTADPNDPNSLPLIQLHNTKMKANAEWRGKIIDQIMRYNGGASFWNGCAENASAIGDTVIKAWLDLDSGEYKIKEVEAVEHCYALWSADDFRSYDAFAYVYQVSKQRAKDEFDVSANVATSPLGMPLAVLATANTVEYISTQPMVTVMEVAGRIQGWCTYGGVLRRCTLGDENYINAVIVGNVVYQIIDDPIKVPHYYVLPNKRKRRRPWGYSDVTKGAISLNQTYIETWSDWRTLSSKVNFPKNKYFGFPTGKPLPKAKPRSAQDIPLGSGMDIQPLNPPTSAGLGQKDFPTQLEEIKEEFVRETSISNTLFDNPDQPANSKQALITAMKSIGDVTDTKRKLWEPIIIKIFEDALTVLAKAFPKSIGQIVNTDVDWHLRMMWPSVLSKDDPTYQAMLLNEFNAGLMSVQTYQEARGRDKEEIDRIREEMGDKITAAIHGHNFPMISEYLILPPLAQMPPKVAINLRGDLDPNQVADLAAERGVVTDQSPFPDVLGPQGNKGLTDNDQAINAGVTSDSKPPAETALYKNAHGQTVPAMQPSDAAGGAPAPSGGEPVAPGGTPSAQPASQPGSGQTTTTPKGKLAQKQQRKGA
jgi:hypothetical protein